MPKLRRFKSVKNPPSVHSLRDRQGEISVPERDDYTKPEKRPSRMLKLTNPDIQEMLRKMGKNGPEEVEIARKTLGLMRQNENLSDIEARVEVRVRELGLNYQIQIPIFGGRNAPSGAGGAVIDMLVRFGAGWLAVEIQGLRWHSRLMTGQDDFLARVRMMGYRIDGLRISQYVALWADDIWQHGDRVIDAGVISGIEWRPNRRVLNG